jgi:hypothetical protein
MRVRAVFVVLALAIVLGACGGSAPQASKTATAQPSAAAVTAPMVPARTAGTVAKPPLAGPTTAPTAPTAAQTEQLADTASARTTPTTSRSAATATALPEVPKRTTAAAWKPSSPQPTPSQAAWALLDAWAANKRASALEAASPAAVAALFAHAYPAPGVQYRGCSSPPGNTASNCVFRDGNDLLSLTVNAFPGGWAVTGATLES